MATEMTWVEIPTKTVKLTIPDHTTNKQATKEFASNVEEVEKFMKDLSEIADQSYDALIVDGSHVIFNKMWELYAALRPTLDHFSKLSQWFTDDAMDKEIKKIAELCDQKSSELEAECTRLRESAAFNDVSKEPKYWSLQEDEKIIKEARSDYIGQ